jgi:hypothetical protein
MKGDFMKFKASIILSSALAFVMVWAALWLIPLWGFRQIKDVNPHAPKAGELERQKQLQGCLDNGGKPESWSNGTFKKCN